MKKRGKKEGIYPFYSFCYSFENALKRSCRWKMCGEGVWSDNWKENVWEEGCHKRKGAGFLISQHIGPCYGPVQPMDNNPDAALKRRSQTSLSLGHKVRTFWCSSPRGVQWDGGMVLECGADAAPAMESSLTCFCSLFFISLRHTPERGLKGRFYLPV